MQSQIHFERDSSWFATVRRLLAPTGGAIMDGLRLAFINGAFLILALAAAGIFSVLGRLVNLAVSIPVAGPGLTVLVLSVLFAAIVWYRYSSRYAMLAQATGRTAHPDRFGFIAGLPFGLLALLLLASGFFGLVVSAAGLNFGGFGEALGKLMFAALFGLLAFGSIVIANLAARGR